jgi:hypothetical protein
MNVSHALNALRTAVRRHFLSLLRLFPSVEANLRQIQVQILLLLLVSLPFFYVTLKIVQNEQSDQTLTLAKREKPPKTDSNHFLLDQTDEERQDSVHNQVLIH